MKNYWLPVIGGPRNGDDFYPPCKPVPGSHVQLGTREEYDEKGVYIIAPDGQSVEWCESPTKGRRKC